MVENAFPRTPESEGLSLNLVHFRSSGNESAPVSLNDYSVAALSSSTTLQTFFSLDSVTHKPRPYLGSHDFRDRDKQNRRNFLASLLIQLSARSAFCCEKLSDLRRNHENSERQPSDEVLIHCLEDMLITIGQHPTYIILDALDECPNSSGIPSPREQVLVLVKEFYWSFPTQSSSMRY